MFYTLRRVWPFLDSCWFSCVAGEREPGTSHTADKPLPLSWSPALALVFSYKGFARTRG